MKRAVLMFLSGVIASCLFTSCISRRTQESWTNPAFEERKLGKTLVMAIGESEFKITRFESYLVSQLQAYGVDVAAAHTVYPTIDDMEEEEIVALVVSNQYDSVIATRVLSEEDRQQMVAIGYRSSPDLGYWGYGMSYSLNPQFASVSNMMEYELETNLYEVESRGLVWSGRKVVYDDKSDSTNIKKVVSRIVRELKKNKML